MTYVKATPLCNGANVAAITRLGFHLGEAESKRPNHDVEDRPLLHQGSHIS